MSWQGERENKPWYEKLFLGWVSMEIAISMLIAVAYGLHWLVSLFT